MQSRAPNPGGGLLPKLLVTTALGYGLAKTWPLVRLELIGSDPASTAWGMGAAIFAIGGFLVLADLAAILLKIARTLRALRPPRRDASARWLTRRQARKAGLGDTKGVFLGILNGLPLFIENGVHGLCLAPARTGKTTGLMMGALCFDIGMSRIVTDLKGELAYQTAQLIAAKHGQRVIIVNPAHKFDLGNAAYNPMIIILDDLAYAPEALATILSQTDVKQVFGVSSYDTARLVSQMLGDEDVVSESFGLGANLGDAPNLNMGRVRQPLLTPDQIRRLPADEQLIFIKNLPPARALKVGYHQVDPWRSQVEPNPLHGYKPFLGKVLMRVTGGRARATRAGTRKVVQARGPLLRPLLAALAVSIPLAPLLVLGTIAAAVLILGWPHILWQQTENGSWCRYLGLPFIAEGFETFGQGHCPLIQWKH
jgi:type IV secretory pathway TraG/TraD family ATPase VirD4